MTLENLTPWIAIAITLALSILVPLFTQIANNRFQHKKAKEYYIVGMVCNISFIYRL